MPVVVFPDELDERIKAVLPPHMHGPKAATLRVCEVIDRWLRRELPPIQGRDPGDENNEKE